MTGDVASKLGALEEVRIFLRGVGQIMLQPSAVTGLLFLAGIALGSPLQAGGAALGAFIGYLYGRVADYGGEWQREGLFSFNACLVALAIVVLFEPGAEMLALLAAGCLAACGVMHLFLRRGLPAYTAPFVLTSWLAWAIGTHALGLAPASVSSLAPQIPDWLAWLIGSQLLGFAPAGPASPAPAFPDLPGAPLAGIGQVMFQPAPLSGALFLLGVFVCPIMRSGWATGRSSALEYAAWALIGSICGGLAASVCGLAPEQVSEGLFGFNAALAALALRMHASVWWPPLLGASLTVPLMLGFQAAGAPAFTAPFVLITWLLRRFVRPQVFKKLQ